MAWPRWVSSFCVGIMMSVDRCTRTQQLQSGLYLCHYCVRVYTHTYICMFVYESVLKDKEGKH
jgi:hypothetical protein